MAAFVAAAGLDRNPVIGVTDANLGRRSDCSGRRGGTKFRADSNPFAYAAAELARTDDPSYSFPDRIYCGA
jgi:hypothetical protein